MRRTSLIVWLGLAAIGCGSSARTGSDAGFDASFADATTDSALLDTGAADSGPFDGRPDATTDGATPAADAAPDGASSDDDAAVGDATWVWDLPPGFPVPAVPADNPMTAEKVELGRHLFYDKRLSRNQTQTCASCHKQALAFTDGRATAVGSTGMSHPRGSMSMVNVAYASTLTWANPLVLQLERQALVPLFGDQPIELGQTNADELVARLRGIPAYQTLFTRAFPRDSEPISLEHLTKALSAFERTIISGRSPYDRFIQREDPQALSQSAQRGYQLFNSEKLECFHCHVGFNLTDHTNYQDKAFFDGPYHNTGLYNIDGKGAYPEPNTGVYEVTQQPVDMGRFKAPTLRNIALTAPYMHDGSIATLSEVLDHYAAGGRTIESGPNAGVGSKSPLKESLIQGFKLTDQERSDVLAFFDSLTDAELLTNPALSDPW